jgi:hypothetical protein
MLAEAGLARRRVALAPGVDQAVDLAHEDVEVGAALLLGRRGLEEEVHQHRLAAADRPHEVDAARAFLLAFSEQALQAAICRLGGEVPLQAHQGVQRRALGRVGPDRALAEARVVGGFEGWGHRRLS